MLYNPVSVLLLRVVIVFSFNRRNPAVHPAEAAAASLSLSRIKRHIPLGRVTTYSLPPLQLGGTLLPVHLAASPSRPRPTEETHPSGCLGTEHARERFRGASFATNHAQRMAQSCIFRPTNPINGTTRGYCPSPVPSSHCAARASVKQNQGCDIH